MTVEEIRRVARKFATEFLSNRNLDIVYDILHPDHRLSSLDSSVSWMEPSNTRLDPELDHFEDLIQIGNSLKKAFPEFQVKIKQLLVEGNYISMYCNLKGNHLGTWHGYPCCRI
ncbi:MAG: ester cyclase [Candidatus Kariarchaeaceae archaeon]|jgi:hypothetical protein